MLFYFNNKKRKTMSKEEDMTSLGKLFIVAMLKEDTYMTWLFQGYKVIYVNSSSTTQITLLMFYM